MARRKPQPRQRPPEPARRSRLRGENRPLFAVAATLLAALWWVEAAVFGATWGRLLLGGVTTLLAVFGWSRLLGPRLLRALAVRRRRG